LAYSQRVVELQDGLLLCFCGLIVILVELPNQQKGISNIFVGTTQMLIDFLMADGSNLVDEDHHIGL